jgi:hypothetical protein
MTDLIWDTQVKRRGEDSGRFFVFCFLVWYIQAKGG